MTPALIICTLAMKKESRGQSLLSFGEILFEIATDPPGFAHDESPGKMGEKLMLPEQYEDMRNRIERKLIPIEVRELD